MKVITSSIVPALGIFAAAPALAADDQLAAVCKANPPDHLPPNAIPGDQFCACIDKETAGNNNLRAEFLASFKIKDMQQRGASLSDAGHNVIRTCIGRR